MIRFVTEHFWLKVSALVLAALMWTVVTSQRRERTFERTFDIPITLVGVPRDLVITNTIDDTVNVRLRGPLSVLRSLTSQNLEATLDLSTARAGRYDVFIRPQALTVPQEIEVVSIDPAKLAFRFEPRRQKIVPIRAFLVGAPPAGFAVASESSVPKEALITGPASLIRDVSEVTTERVIVTGRTSTFRSPVALVSDHPLVRLVEPTNTQVTVEIVAETPPSDPDSAPPGPGTTEGQQ